MTQVCSQRMKNNITRFFSLILMCGNLTNDTLVHHCTRASCIDTSQNYITHHCTRASCRPIAYLTTQSMTPVFSQRMANSITRSFHSLIMKCYHICYKIGSWFAEKHYQNYLVHDAVVFSQRMKKNYRTHFFSSFDVLL